MLALDTTMKATFTSPCTVGGRKRVRMKVLTTPTRRAPMLETVLQIAPSTVFFASDISAVSTSARRSGRD
jgi:hypothetical protein